MLRHRLPVIALLLLAHGTAAEELEPQTVTRLAALGKLWGAVKYAHPSMGYQEFDLDGAAVRAIERVRVATSARAFADAAQEMVAVLGDPMTRIEETCVETSVPDTAATSVEPLAPGTIFIPSAALRRGDPAELRQAVLDAHSIVVDLRPAPGRCSSSLPLLGTVEPLLFDGTITPPGERMLAHFGYASQRPDAPAPYSSRFVTKAAASISGTRSAPPRALLFVTDSRTTLTPVTAALVRARRAAVLAVGRFAEESAVGHRIVPLGEGFEAVIRTAEPISDGRLTAAGVTTLPGSTTEQSIRRTALQLVTPGRRRSVGLLARQLPEYRFIGDQWYAAMEPPPLPYRVLAAYRFWNVIEYFYGYPQMVAPWEPRLAQMIARLAAATTSSEYELTICEISTFVPDGHTRVGSKVFTALRGEAQSSVSIARVEGKPGVITILHESAAAAGVRLGDEVLAIDGRPIEQRIEELRQYISASREEMRLHYATVYAPRGAEGSSATFRFRRPDGTVYEATLSRSASYLPAAPQPPWRVLPEGIGYIHVGYLAREEVDAAIAAVQGTRALILDMRGYPAGTSSVLWRKLNTTGNKAVSQIRIPEVTAGVRTDVLEVQEYGTPPPPAYRNPTATLHDERSISAAEHFCLAMEASHPTTFVGSNTAGANGSVSYMMLPGAIWVQFTGMDVRHVDGRQLQGIGIEPDVRVTPTIAGLAAGRDEVLEAAIQVLLAK